MAKSCIHGYITGKVQGVFFRQSTQQQAYQLKLTGWVRNLADGRVELLACGEEDALRHLTAWLWQGPPAATVDNVDITAQPWQEFADFVINS